MNLLNYHKNDVIGGEINLERWVNYCLFRYQFLSKLESISSHLDWRRRVGCFQSIENMIQRNNDEDCELRDRIGHLILQLVCTKSVQKTEWFIRQELLLFKLEIERIKSSFISAEYIPQEYRTQQESWKKWLVNELCRCKEILGPQFANYRLVTYNDPKFRNVMGKFRNYFAPGDSDYDGLFIEIDWRQVLFITSTRGCLIYDGLAYIPIKMGTSVLEGCYHSYLKFASKKARDHIPHIKEHGELFYLFLDEFDQVLVNNCLKDSPSNQGPQSLELDFFYQNASQLLPPCIWEIWRSLHLEHHLKHESRKRLAFFLRGVGIHFNDKLKIFKGAFLQKVSQLAWEKEYEHNFVNLLKTKKYPMIGCCSIIKQSGIDGCPWKEFNFEQIQKYLQKEITNQTPERKEFFIHDILEKQQKQQYQSACRTFWKSRFITNDDDDNGITDDGIGLHPLKFYQASLKAIKNKQ